MARLQPALRGDIYLTSREIEGPPGHIERSTSSENGAFPTHPYSGLHSLYVVDVSPDAAPPQCSLFCYPMPQKNSLDQSASNPLIFIGLEKTTRGLRPISPVQTPRDYPPPETKPSLTPPRTPVSAVRNTPHRPASIQTCRQKNTNPEGLVCAVMVEPGGIEPPSASPLQAVLHA